MVKSLLDGLLLVAFVPQIWCGCFDYGDGPKIGHIIYLPCGFDAAIPMDVSVTLDSGIPVQYGSNVCVQRDAETKEVETYCTGQNVDASSRIVPVGLSDGNYTFQVKIKSKPTRAKYTWIQVNDTYNTTVGNSTLTLYDASDAQTGNINIEVIQGRTLLIAFKRFSAKPTHFNFWNMSGSREEDYNELFYFSDPSPEEESCGMNDPLKNSVFLFNDTSHVLLKISVDCSWRGKYRLSSSPQQEPGHSTDVFMEVEKAGPLQLSIDFNPDAKDKSAYLTCEGLHFEAEYEWFLWDNLLDIEDKNRYDIHKTGHKTLLVIKNVTSDDIGSYSCKVESCFKYTSNTILLEIPDEDLNDPYEFQRKLGQIMFSILFAVVLIPVFCLGGYGLYLRNGDN